MRSGPNFKESTHLLGKLIQASENENKKFTVTEISGTPKTEQVLEITFMYGI